MSYDLRVWCVSAPSVNGVTMLASGKGWLVNASASACLAEDVPDEVMPLLPGIAHRVDLSLQPIDAPAVGRTALWKHARAIAKQARGVVEDPQEDTVELPSGTKRYVPPKREGEARVAELELTWWMDHARLAERSAIERVLAIFERTLPEAMPRRYGLFEPPKHQLVETGRAHLVDFLVDNITDLMVWYPHAPVTSVRAMVPRPLGWIDWAGQRSYRATLVSVGVLATALEQPGWAAALERLWRELSRELSPFYGEVRTLGGRIARGARLWHDSATEEHPVKLWWWRGLPQRLGHAIVVGERYLAAWPELAAQAQLDDGLAWFSTGDWRSPQDLSDKIGMPPEPLRAPPEDPRGDRLAARFPFPDGERA